MLIKGNGRKRGDCCECDKFIASNDYKHNIDNKTYCFHHGRIKNLHSAALRWINEAKYKINHNQFGGVENV